MMIQRRSAAWFASRRKRRQEERGSFCPFLWFSRHTSEADYVICGIDPKASRPEIPSLLVYTREVLRDYVRIFHRDLSCAKILIWRRNRWNLRGRGAQDLLLTVVAKMIPPTTAR